jgi:hypothetical protein
MKLCQVLNFINHQKDEVKTVIDVLHEQFIGRVVVVLSLINNLDGCLDAIERPLHFGGYLGQSQSIGNFLFGDLLLPVLI